MNQTSFTKIRMSTPRLNYETILVVRQRGSRFVTPSIPFNSPSILIDSNQNPIDTNHVPGENPCSLM